MGEKITRDIGHQTAKDVGPEKQETKGAVLLPQPTAWRKVLGYWVGKPAARVCRADTREERALKVQSVLLEYSSEF